MQALTKISIPTDLPLTERMLQRGLQPANVNIDDIIAFEPLEGPTDMYGINLTSTPPGSREKANSPRKANVRRLPALTSRGPSRGPSSRAKTRCASAASSRKTPASDRNTSALTSATSARQGGVVT